jgi:hypothetical protein
MNAIDYTNAAVKEKGAFLVHVQLSVFSHKLLMARSLRSLYSRWLMVEPLLQAIEQ